MTQSRRMLFCGVLKLFLANLSSDAVRLEGRYLTDGTLSSG